MASFRYAASATTYTIDIVWVSGSTSWTAYAGTPITQTKTATYDAASNAASSTNALGTINFGYDAAGRLTSEAVPGQSQYGFAYDAAGRSTSVADPTGSRTFQYDRLGRLAQSTDQAGVQTAYAYDLASNQTSVTRAGSLFGYHYDLENRISQRTQASDTTTYAYSDHRNPTSVTFPSGEQDSRTFNGVGQMTWLGVRPQTGATPTLARSFSYDADGNLTTVGDVTVPSLPTTISSYGYDQADRLTSETQTVSGNPTTTSYTYDADGDVTSAVSGSSTTGFTYNSSSQLIARTDPSGAATLFFYDGAGDLVDAVTASGATRYGWSADGRLTNVWRPDQSQVIFTYDATGQRLTKYVSGVTSTYAYESGRLAAISVSGGSGPSFTYDPSGTPLTMALGGSTYTYHLDSQGSVVELTDSTHQPVATYRYDAWGNLLQSTGQASILNANPYTFLGGLGVLRDPEAGLYYMHARYYDPADRRFISLDPAVGGETVPDYQGIGHSARDCMQGQCSPHLARLPKIVETLKESAAASARTDMTPDRKSSAIAPSPSRIAWTRRSTSEVASVPLSRGHTARVRYLGHYHGLSGSLAEAISARYAQTMRLRARSARSSRAGVGRG